MMPTPVFSLRSLTLSADISINPVSSVKCPCYHEAENTGPFLSLNLRDCGNDFRLNLNLRRRNLLLGLRALVAGALQGQLVGGPAVYAGLGHRIGEKFYRPYGVV